MEKSSGVAAIIVAAGRGVRMGERHKKQFIELFGLPILAHTVLPFSHCEAVNEIYLVVPKEDEEICRRKVADRLVGKQPVHLVRGGSSRQESVFNGLQATKGRFEFVVIHDGVRPLIRVTEIMQTIEMARLYGSAILAIPAGDTVKTVG